MVPDPHKNPESKAIGGTYVKMSIQDLINAKIVKHYVVFNFSRCSKGISAFWVPARWEGLGGVWRGLFFFTCSHFSSRLC